MKPTPRASLVPWLTHQSRWANPQPLTSRSVFNEVFARVPEHPWDTTSLCQGWTARDVVDREVDTPRGRRPSPSTGLPAADLAIPAWNVADATGRPCSYLTATSRVARARCGPENPLARVHMTWRARPWSCVSGPMKVSAPRWRHLPLNRILGAWRASPLTWRRRTNVPHQCLHGYI